MIKNKINVMILITGLLLIFSSISLYADIDRSKYGKDSDMLQNREVRQVFDLQKNTVSNFEFFTTNYGIFGFDLRNRVGGGVWPRGSRNQYFFAGGLWFAVQKKQYDSLDYRRKYVSIGYNPNSGISWYVPGRINPEGPNGPEALDFYEYDPSNITQYRTYFSTDFVPGTGEGIGISADYENWPIWDSSNDPTDTLQYDRYFGNYIEAPSERNMATHPKGPAFISGEDIFATYKDTDLSRYESGISVSREQGYPLMLQYEQMIYSWGFGDYKDFIFLKYEITNYSDDTLWDCWAAPVMDVDIAIKPNTQFGAGNDRANFYEWDTTLNLAYQWSNPDRGERGQGFGYLGFDFLESPAVIKYFDTTYVEDDQGNIIDTNIVERLPQPGEEMVDFVRRDKKVYTTAEQLGLVTFRNWSIEDDKDSDEVRYNYMAEGVRDGDTGPGDKRFMMATGPFHMRPADTVRVVVGIVLATPAVKDEPDGSLEDLQELVRKDKFMQLVYDNNFQAPRPPDRAVIIEAVGYNNATMFKWDDASVISDDKYEKGLDFLGYRIYRARRPELEEYSTHSTETSGPFGWKELAQYELPKPFVASTYRAGREEDPALPMIDSLRIIGPYVDEFGEVIDTMKFYVMRIPRGVQISDYHVRVDDNRNPMALTGYIPRIFSPAIDSSFAINYLPDPLISIDTTYFYKPWGPYWWELWSNSVNNEPFYQGNANGDRIFRPNNNNKLWDAMVGVAEINPSLQKYNPMFFRKKTIEITPTKFENYLRDYPDGVIERQDTIYTVNEFGDTVDIDYVLFVDSVFFPKTYKKVEINGTERQVIDILVKNRQVRSIMHDLDNVIGYHKTMYQYIQDGRISTIEFQDVQSDSTVRYDIMVPYMRMMTNNNTFFDIGDDDGDAVIKTSQDPTETERLINNIDYYYKVLAYDEGDYLQPTEIKQNDASQGLPNLTRIYPTAAPVSKKVEFEIIHVDSSKIGGLRNFSFFSVDLERTLQHFEGEILELSFEPSWSQNSLIFPGTESTIDITLYQTLIELRKQSTGDLLYRRTVSYEVIPCNFSYRGLFTEDAQSYVFASNVEDIIDPITGDTITFNKPTSREVRDREGTFFTGDFNNPGFCNTYGFRPTGTMLEGYGTLGFSFDYYISQYGGKFRGDETTNETAKTPDVNAVTPVKVSTDAAVTGRVVTYDPNLGYSNFSFMTGSFNNGPGIYEVTFTPGGTETMNVKFGTQEATFNVDYLNVEVRNTLTKEIVLTDGQNDIVHYPDEVEHMELPYSDGFRLGTILNIPERHYPHPVNLGLLPGSTITLGNESKFNLVTNEYLGKFNLAAYGWVDSRGETSFRMKRGIPSNAPEGVSIMNLGQQGRYYLSAKSTNGNHQLDFTHALNVDGVFFGFDYANSGSTIGNNDIGRENIQEYVYGPDFTVGDKATIKTIGGAFGLPMPGAKVLVKISEKTPLNEITDDMMDDVRVVPNPYYISHQGVKSPYDNKLYFTKLPPRATIDIFTINGELVISMEHDSFSGEATDRHAVKVWDLMSKNAQRVQSQGFIAVIRTPDGAETVKKFSVVVGGFNLNDKIIE